MKKGAFDRSREWRNQFLRMKCCVCLTQTPALIGTPRVWHPITRFTIPCFVTSHTCQCLVVPASIKALRGLFQRHNGKALSRLRPPGRPDMPNRLRRSDIRLGVRIRGQRNFKTRYNRPDQYVWDMRMSLGTHDRLVSVNRCQCHSQSGHGTFFRAA
jgi:hypothetical protein